MLYCATTPRIPDGVTAEHRSRLVAESNNFAPVPTGAGLTQFIDYLIAKGYVKTATGSAMKTAVREVLSATEGDDWEATDLDSLDFTDSLRRFETLRAMKFTSGSLRAYKSRFIKAVDLFAEFRVNPGTWRPNIKQRERRPKSEQASRVAPNISGASVKRSVEAPVANAAPTPTEARVAIITYPFPIRDGVLASIELPADLTAREAGRLASFIEALAVDQPGNPGAGAPADERA